MEFRPTFFSIAFLLLFICDTAAASNSGDSTTTTTSTFSSSPTSNKIHFGVRQRTGWGYGKSRNKSENIFLPKRVVDDSSSSSCSSSSGISTSLLQQHILHLPRGGDLGNLHVDKSDQPNNPPLTEKKMKALLKQINVYPLLTKNEKQKSPIFLSKTMAEKRLDIAQPEEFDRIKAEAKKGSILVDYVKNQDYYTIVTAEDGNLRKIGNDAFVYLIILEEQECIRVCFTEKDCDVLMEQINSSSRVKKVKQSIHTLFREMMDENADIGYRYTEFQIPYHQS